jgi:hypothetical protein
MIWHMRIACRTPKATNTHSQYVILTAFPLQQWLHERASILRYTYNAYLVTLLYLRRRKMCKIYRIPPNAYTGLFQKLALNGNRLQDLTRTGEYII